MAKQKQKGVSKTSGQAPQTAVAPSAKAAAPPAARVTAGRFFSLLTLALFLYFAVLLRHLLYIASRYDFPAVIGNFGGRFEDIVRLGFVREFLGSAVSALGVFPLVGGILPALILGTGAYFFWRVLAHGKSGGTLSRQGTFLYAAAAALALALFPPIQGYYIFGCVSMGFIWGWYLGFFAASGIAALAGAIVSPRKRMITAAAVTFALYPLVGPFAVLGLLLAVRIELLDRAAPQRGARAAALAAAAALIPRLWYPLYVGTVSLKWVYAQGMIHLIPLRRDAVTSAAVHWLTALVLAATLFPVLTAMCFGKSQNAPPSGAIKGKLSSRAKAPARALSPLAFWGLAAALVLAAAALALHDRLFLATAAMARPLDEKNWEKILLLEARVPRPNAPMILLRRLALKETGRDGEEYFVRPNIPYFCESAKKVSSYRIFGPEVLFSDGNIELVRRLMMNDDVSLRGKSPYCAKTLFLCAMASGDYPLAARHLDRWEKLTFAPSSLSPYREALRAKQAEQNPPPPGAEKINAEQISPKAKGILNDIAAAAARIPDDYIIPSSLAPLNVIADAATHRDSARLSTDDLETQLLDFLTSGDLPRFAKAFPLYAERLAEASVTVPTMLRQGWCYTQAIGLAPIDNSDPKAYPTYPDEGRQLQRFDAALKGIDTPQFDEQFAGTWWYYAFKEKDVPTY